MQPGSGPCGRRVSTPGLGAESPSRLTRVLGQLPGMDPGLFKGWQVAVETFQKFSGPAASSRLRLFEVIPCHVMFFV